MKSNSKSDFDFYKPAKLDIGLIVIILGFSFFSLFRIAIMARGESTDKKKAFVYQNGKLKQEIGLSGNREVRLLGGNFVVQIKEGRIRVVKADCPEHICMNTGWIQHSGQTIVCVPNKLLIEIKSTEPVMVDAVTY